MQCETGHGIHCPLLYTCPVGQMQVLPDCTNPLGHTQLVPPVLATKGEVQVEHILSV